MSQTLIPARAVPPGRILLRELEARGWTQKDLAEIMGRPLQAINEIVHGGKRITPETALELAEAFGTSPELWTNLEANYRISLARQKKDGQAISRRSQLFSLAPISELIKRSWIRRCSSLEELETEVCAFLGISSLEQTPKITANLRDAKARGPEISAQVAWIKRVEYLAREQTLPDFDPTTLKKALPEILSLAAKPEDVALVPEKLLGLGVHFLIVPLLPRTYLDGAALYIGGHPVVALTLRYDRIDSFWFTLMHELAHVIAGHPGVYLDSLEDGATDESIHEQEANRLAGDWLVDRSALDAFVKQTSPRFSRNRILQLALSLHRHPGIVLGRLHREGIVEFKNLGTLLVRVRPLLAEWIDVPAPRRFSSN